MKINLEKLKMHSWFEDEAGNIYPNTPSLDLPKDKEHFTYHSVFPCKYTEELYEYCIHESKDPVNMTFSHLLSMNVSYGSKTSQECIVAMVNSGDYTLEEAIFVYTNACERCSNVLLHKYLNGADGYEEYSEEWYKANTVCDWCKEEEQ